ncbi:MAG: methyltransferase [Chloroflexi bacterium RBG_19FT_COMBO_49_13]|nr:MAG: methyltransferase [Chloroflexi bacterium RBG_19FT_COMBO_49_13]
MSNILTQISNAVVEGQINDISSLTITALNSGLTAKDVLDKGLLPGMEIIGIGFKRGDRFIPEVLISATTMQIALDILKPLLAIAGEKMAGKVIIGTVKGDVHDIGKKLVGMMLEGAGFEVIDLGKDVPMDKFVDAVKKEKPDLVAMSALLTTTMVSMSQTIAALKDAGLRETVKIMIGGAPVTADYAKQIGADGYAANAPEAVELAMKLAD